MLDPVAVLAEAVAIQSVSGDESELSSFLVDRFAPWVDRSYSDAVGNAVVEVGSGPLSLLVLGHLDTVPGAVPVRREQGRLYGRGSVDAKGPLCCALFAAAGLTSAARDALSVRVVAAVEEELPSSKGARHLLATLPTPDLVIIAEPSGWDAVTLGYKGRLNLHLETELPNRHSAEEVPTAAEDVVSAWNTVSRYVASVNEGVAGVFDRLQLSLATVASEDDGLRQRASAEVGFRLPPSLPPDELEREVAALQFPHEVRMRFFGGEVAYRGPRDTQLTRVFRAAIHAAGGRARTKIKTGTSDMNVVAPTWPVPMLAYGPGDARLDHSPDEHLDEAEYLQAVAVLSDALERLARSGNRRDQ